jgi:hypothetical protein
VVVVVPLGQVGVVVLVDLYTSSLKMSHSDPTRSKQLGAQVTRFQKPVVPVETALPKWAAIPSSRQVVVVQQILQSAKVLPVEALGQAVMVVMGEFISTM